MLKRIEQIDDDAVDRLFCVYAESMAALASDFADDAEMRTSYREFLEGFVSVPDQFVLVEVRDGTWASALRAVPMGEGCWFLEAVETQPAMRRSGCGRALLGDAIGFLRTRGARELCCIIAPKNVASEHLHEGCGFVTTVEPPVNPWGEVEEGCVLYRCILV